MTSRVDGTSSGTIADAYAYFVQRADLGPDGAYAEIDGAISNRTSRAATTIVVGNRNLAGVEPRNGSLTLTFERSGPFRLQ